MNDINKNAVPSFKVDVHEPVIETDCFGKVTVHDIGADRVEELINAHADEKDNMPMLRELLILACEGEHGERFTMELLRKLPARALQDRQKLIIAAARLNGMQKQDVEKE